MLSNASGCFSHTNSIRGGDTELDATLLRRCDRARALFCQMYV